MRGMAKSSPSLFSSTVVPEISCVYAATVPLPFSLGTFTLLTAVANADGCCAAIAAIPIAYVTSSVG